MKLSVGSWTSTKAAVAVAGALAIAGAIGSAVAMSPIVQPPIKWAGGAEFGRFIADSSPLFQVPAGRSLILTDLFVTNDNGFAKAYSVYAGPGGSCQGALERLSNIIVPAGVTSHLAPQTGIGFGSGQAICIQGATTNAGLTVNGRGFLFTAAPAS